MKTLGQIVLVLVVLYVTSYIVLRSKWTHTWDKDGKAYMHFPVSPPWVYAFYRPLSLVDAGISGMQFHIGPHPETEIEPTASAKTLPAASPATAQ